MSPKYKYNRDDLTTEPEVQGYIDRAPDAWVKGLLGFLYIYGPRISEALKIRVKDFTFTEDLLMAKIPTLKRRKLKKSGPYGVAEYRILRVEIPETPFVEVVREYIGIRRHLLRDFTVREEAILFPFHRVTAYLKLKDLSPNISPHLFRHDRLMKLALAGASGPVLMDWAGWSDLRPATYYLQKAGLLAGTFAGKVR